MISLTIASIVGRAVLDQVASHLLEQVPALFRLKCLDQMLLGRGQNALEPDDDQIINQMGANVLGPAAHVLLLEAAHALGNGTFDFALSLHLERQDIIKSAICLALRPALPMMRAGEVRDLVRVRQNIEVLG